MTMDPETRRMVEDAIALGDQSARDFELWKADYQPRRAASDHETQASVFTQAQTEAIGYALSHVRRELRDEIKRGLETTADVVGGESGLLERRLLDRIERLEEVGRLRAENEALRRQLEQRKQPETSSDDDAVIDFDQARSAVQGGRDAAAPRRSIIQF